MTTIWKYELAVGDVQEVKMPSKHEVLTVAMQNGVPCIWVKVEEGSEPVLVKIHTYGTGHPIMDTIFDGEYIGSYMLQGEALVFHVFQGVTLDGPI